MRGSSLCGLVGVALFAAIGTDLVSAAEAPHAAGAGPTVNIRLVAKSEFSFTPNELTTLPVSDSTSFAPGTVFYVEVWAQTSHATGLVSVSLDIVFDSQEVSVTANDVFPFSGGLFHGLVFTSLTNGLADNGAGRVEDLSGSYAPASGCAATPTGVGPVNWSRVAIVEMQANVSTNPRIMPEATGNGVYGTAVCGMANTPESDITYTGINALVTDIDGDGDLDLNDYAILQSCHTGPNAGPVGLECDRADLDRDSDVDLADWRVFQLGG
jgi:hypothetical protein